MTNRSHPFFFLWWGATICLLVFSLLSCAPVTVSNVGVGEVVDGEEGEQFQKDYIIKDKILAKEITVMDIKARHVGEFLEGMAVIKNPKAYTVRFEYHFEWYDSDGFPIDSGTTLWTPEVLYGAETKWIHSLCPKPDAKGFKVMIRKPNPVTK